MKTDKNIELKMYYTITLRWNFRLIEKKSFLNMVHTVDKKYNFR